MTSGQADDQVDIGEVLAGLTIHADMLVRAGLTGWEDDARLD